MDLVFYPKDELFCTRFRRTHYHFARNPTKISGSLELVGNLMKSYESNLFVLLHGLLSQYRHFMSFSWFTRTYVHVLLQAGACNDAQFACFARAVRGTRERYCIGASDKDIPNSKGTQTMEQLVNNSFCFSYMKRTGITVKACLLMCVFSLNPHLEWEDDKQSLLIWIYNSS